MVSLSISSLTSCARDASFLAGRSQSCFEERQTPCLVLTAATLYVFFKFVVACTHRVLQPAPSTQGGGTNKMFLSEESPYHNMSLLYLGEIRGVVFLFYHVLSF